MRKILIIAAVALLAAAVVFAGGAGQSKGAAKKVRLGVTIEDFNDVFMRYLLDQLTDEAGKAGAEVITADGKRDPNEQIKQIENFITQGVDAIVIILVEGEARRARTRASWPAVRSATAW